jgi:mannose-6-phosphate isomerase-like protein (cupin superfamily)
MAGVGSKVVFEDDKIKVWEFNLEPGEQTAVHTHELEYVFYVIDGSTLEVFDADGKFVTPLEFADGDVLPLRLEGDELIVVGNEALRVPATHSARNAGTTVYREILIEKK